MGDLKFQVRHPEEQLSSSEKGQAEHPSIPGLPESECSGYKQVYHAESESNVLPACLSEALFLWLGILFFLTDQFPFVYILDQRLKHIRI